MLPVTPRPRSWSGVCVSIAVAATSRVPSFPVPVVVLRIELSVTCSSDRSGRPALDYRFQSGTPESNREPPAPKAGVLPSAPLPACLQSERPDLNRRSPGPRPGAIPGFATFCRGLRAPRSQWVGRCSNPRLLVFSQVLHRLSYRPEQKKPGVFCDTGLWQKSRYFDGRVSQAPVAHGEGIRRLTGEMPRAFLLANVTRPQGHHFWHLLLWGDRVAAGGYCPSLLLGRGSRPEGSQEFSRNPQKIRRSKRRFYSRVFETLQART